jgi:hypothetical protein
LTKIRERARPTLEAELRLLESRTRGARLAVLLDEIEVGTTEEAPAGSRDIVIAET